ncbi:hypothetical protein PAXRUDRAFT_12214 [Paxillus rubicundulus Ve08.2h10]|uniref:SH3 domain-containing protein n=1 Tax=Paxillus rubicundulus Ve08.2h10 TaxID=930991 RepID=A0A0D0E7M9_9AGAM|nr:hypothetical protein PAXRUDRAFT_12214 [Paxillus rubicundulus Ve08.2h10]
MVSAQSKGTHITHFLSEATLNRPHPVIEHPTPLNLGLNVITPSQPFPSPGSSFLPPPVPGPHEFAIRPPSAGRKMSKKDGDDQGADMSKATTSCNGNAPPRFNLNADVDVGDHATGSATSPTGVVSPTRAPLSFIRSFLPRFVVSMLNIPRSLLRVLHFQEPATPTTASASDSGASSTYLDPVTPTTCSTPHTPTEFTYTSSERRPALTNPQGFQSHDIPAGNVDPRFALQHNSNPRLSTQSVTSLTSSRPAPPSPAMSRRASGLSRSSSNARSRPVSGVSGTSSRPVSGVTGSLFPSDVHSRSLSGAVLSGATAPGGGLSRTPSGRRPKDVLGMSSVAESGEQGQDFPGPTPTPTTIMTMAIALIKIRDYGFDSSDPRFSGEGLHVPRPNRLKTLEKRLTLRCSTSSAGSSSSSEGDDENQWEDEPEGGINGWGGFKWGFGRGWGLDVGGAVSGTDSGFPSRGDLDRNFGELDEAESDGEEEEEVYGDAEELSDEQYEDDDAEGEGEPLLLPGLYRALYAFEPEGTAEMKLDEDQMVRVIGRGGGVGWAVVVKDGLKDAGVHALVPESYLELVRLDGHEETV